MWLKVIKIARYWSTALLYRSMVAFWLSGFKIPVCQIHLALSRSTMLLWSFQIRARFRRRTLFFFIIRIGTKFIPQTLTYFGRIVLQWRWWSRKCNAVLTNVGIQDTDIYRAQLSMYDVALLSPNLWQIPWVIWHTHFISSSHSKNPFLPMNKIWLEARKRYLFALCRWLILKREFDRSTPALAWCGSDIYHLASYVTMTKAISPKSVRKEIPFHVMGSCAFIGNIYSFPQT